MDDELCSILLKNKTKDKMSQSSPSYFLVPPGCGECGGVAVEESNRGGAGWGKWGKA